MVPHPFEASLKSSENRVLPDGLTGALLFDEQADCPRRRENERRIKILVFWLIIFTLN